MYDLIKGIGSMTAESKTIKEKIYEALKNAKTPLSPKQIAQITGLNYNTVRARLHDLRKENKASRLPEGWVAN
jgi:predicted ArsR family transcriptional regulator